MQGSILFPDVETYTNSAVASLGRTNETTGYWIHGIQVNWMEFFNHFNSLHIFSQININCILYAFPVWRSEISANVGSYNCRSWYEY